MRAKIKSTIMLMIQFDVCTKFTRYNYCYIECGEYKVLSKALVKATNQLITDGKIKFTTESNLDFLKIVLEVITKTNEKDE